LADMIVAFEYELQLVCGGIRYGYDWKNSNSVKVIRTANGDTIVVAIWHH